MESRIVVDSCVDFNDEVFPPHDSMDRIPFKISIDDEEIIDKNLDTNYLISKMKASKNKIVTACPSPNDFLTSFQKCKQTFVVTISSKLSASYNSAVIAKEILQEDNKSDHFVHIFDSLTAAAGETLVALKVKQLLEEKFSTTQIIEKTNHYIANLKTLFVLESMDNLIKNGRVSPIKGLIGSMLHIVPIMGADTDGTIVLREQVRGRKKAIKTLIEMIGRSNIDFNETILSITHVNAKEKAHAIKEEIQRLYSFKDVLIFKSGGLSTVYADDGGLVIAY